MIKNSRAVIDLILNNKKLAIAGVSHKNMKFGNSVFKEALKNGFDAIPINPKGGVIENRECIESVAQLNDDVVNLLIVTNKRDTEKVMEEAIAKGIKNIWIQNGCETDKAVEMAQKSGINLVYKACFMMYNNPRGIHKFHQTISKWTGSYAKEQLN